jgi:tripartite-type tricarboxylate transporter receptor subunit TctC
MKAMTSAALAAALGLGVGTGALAADWTPEQPITIIVPWSAGGSTDQVPRVVAGELEGALGQKVVIVNQPGASIGSWAGTGPAPACPTSADPRPNGCATGWRTTSSVPPH